MCSGGKHAERNAVRAKAHIRRVNRAAVATAMTPATNCMSAENRKQDQTVVPPVHLSHVPKMNGVPGLQYEKGPSLFGTPSAPSVTRPLPAAKFWAASR